MDIKELKDHCEDQIARTRDNIIFLEHRLILEIIEENEQLKNKKSESELLMDLFKNSNAPIFVINKESQSQLGYDKIDNLWRVFKYGDPIKYSCNDLEIAIEEFLK